MSPNCCWNAELTSLAQCPQLREGEEELLLNRKKRLLQRCLDCPDFFRDLSDFRERDGDHHQLLSTAVEELKRQKVLNQSLQGELDARNREFQFLHEVSSTIQSSLDLDEIISLALTAITAGQGFGLNRAILLLVDQDRQTLAGYVAVGPRRREDAERIWREIEENHYSLQEMASRFFEQKMAKEKENFRDLLEMLSLPLARKDHLFIQTLNGRKTRHIKNLWEEPDVDRHQVAALEVDEIVLVPLRSRNRRVGLLLADNVINRRPISKLDLASLETFALPVSFAIERAALHEQLQEELGKTREANRRLEEQQDLMVRMEKMALVGKIVSHFAHSIRNPLMIIGGFARSLSKNMAPDDERRRYIESIVRETRKLEEVLREALNYSEALHPTCDSWDTNQLVTTVYSGLHEELERHRIAGRLDLGSNLPQVQMDFKQMSFCLRSILVNAIEAMTDGGSLVVSTVRHDDSLRIIVRDTGEGLESSVVQSIAEPFAAGNGKTTSLSLSLCTRILQGHGGQLLIDSVPGRGTTVSLSLPLPS